LKEHEHDSEDDVETRQHVFQDEINRFYSGMPAKMWYVYSWLFSNYLIFMLYGSALPIMYVFGAIYFVLSYLNAKYYFFNWVKRGFRFDESIAMWSIKLMKFGVLFHMMMSLFVFTNKRVLTPANYTT
jgi:hypothetical protein